MPTYGYNTIPGDEITTKSGGTVEVGVAFDASVALIGGYDAVNGSASANSVHEIESLSEAETKFGADSELHKQVEFAFDNGAATVYAVPVAETSTTESFASVQSGTLSNAPAMDPNVNTEHDITAQDTTAGTSATVNIVYASAPSAPSSSNEINLNPVNGEWKADASSSYDITYDYGDYSGAIKSGVLDENPRYPIVLTENQSVASTLDTELGTEADNFDFMRGIVGGMPDTKPADYSDSFDSQRLIVVEAARATKDNTEYRTTGAVGGKLANNDLGDSATYESLNAETFDSLKGHPQTPSEAGDFIDKQVLPLAELDEIKIVKGITTSTTAKFQRIHKAEVADEGTEISHIIAQDFVGENNTPERRDDFRDRLLLDLRGMANDGLLASSDGTRPYSVKVIGGATDTEVDVTIGMDIVDVMEDIDVDISIGDVITNQGAS